ncbi:outer membrane beta-barrel protein [Helicobacter heilmannii]|uniref:outer membrane beta-barrel protein n=2 Tax=Helicobacter heilmannii TaxID=35817 RepID=UPI00028B7139|nr:outer membrane beta-barrel protein [Helicobacter heilmannii]CCM73431.1 hypothetical protein BN341_6430 [Helicobacter heilmannii ASB1.4]
MVKRGAVWLMFLFMPAQAHSFVSYLSGPFLSFGMGLGGGSVLQTDRDMPENDTEKMQAYNAKIAAYNNLKTALQQNQAQTLTKLKSLVNTLSSLEPSSQALKLLTSDPTSGSVSAYQQYLNQILENYENTNQEIVNNAQSSVTDYKNALNTTIAKNQSSLANAINIFNSMNNQIAKIDQNLKIPYTPMTLSPPLTPNANVSSMTPTQVYSTLQVLKQDIDQAFATANQQIQKLDPKIPSLTPPNISIAALPTPPKISASAAALPSVSVPQKPSITIANANLQSKSLQLGVQTQVGYQKYFNSFFGISYYGYLGYRYLYMSSFVRDSSGVDSVDRYQVGFGANMLFNLYSKIKKTRAKRPKIQAYGLFGGLLGMVDIWSAQFSGSSTAYIRNNVNINAVFGLSLRVDQFKWSIGIHMPLINQIRTVRTPLETGGSESLKIVDNYKSAALFMNFTEIF